MKMEEIVPPTDAEAILGTLMLEHERQMARKGLRPRLPCDKRERISTKDVAFFLSRVREALPADVAEEFRIPDTEARVLLHRLKKAGVVRQRPRGPGAQDYHSARPFVFVEPGRRAPPKRSKSETAKRAQNQK
tara:strand:+ start:877 stop:1275 length:399 start_codon:yes stop_codon:yes gene_type:complete